jgi:hypothetical protein
MTNQSKQSTNTGKAVDTPTTATVSREKTFQPNKYNVENLYYPMDLFSNANSSAAKVAGNNYYNEKYLNYVVFYINVSDQSRVFTEAKAEVVGDVDKTEQNTIQGKQASIGAAAGTAATGGAAAGAVAGTLEGGGRHSGSIGTKGGTATFLKGTLGTAGARAVQGGALAGAQVGYGKVLETATGLKPTNKIKRLKSAIALHVPQEVQVGYRASYGEEELGAIFGAAGEVATGGAGAVNTGAKAAVVKGLEINPARGLLSSLYKAAPNPRKEQLFKSMEFRRFSFNYQFAPRSPEEASNIKRIINLFKYHMHPEFQDSINKMLYLFPSEFDIVYYFGDKEHPHLNRISTCVLTDMNVNYSPNGQFTTFKDGFPSQINVQMQFLELETLTKERFTDKDYTDPTLPSF